MDRSTSARPPGPDVTRDAESLRLDEDRRRVRNWKRWGPYLAERQWGTVREDYSANGDSWNDLPHDHARSRAYRWGEDGLLGICDRQGRLCFALALWNERDPILKERLFGLTGPEGNHGEDVKEQYFYLDSTPTHSWMQALYKYPLDAFPYERLVLENGRRGLGDPEFELVDTGVFDGDRYADVLATYAKAGPDDVLIRIDVSNRSREPARLHLLPTLWFRNHWAWGRTGEGYGPKPSLELAPDGSLVAEHFSLGRFRLHADSDPPFEWLFTENETNRARLFGDRNPGPVKDGFHERVIGGRREATAREPRGTKAAAWYRLELPPGGEAAVRLRLRAEAAADGEPFGEAFEAELEARRREADAFYDTRLRRDQSEDERRVARQALAGLLWSKQLYHYVVERWLEGDPTQPPPPPSRLQGRNKGWPHLFNRDVLSMPDKWEYPWYAAWDLAFHALPFAQIDVDFARQQLLLLLREWYMHPNGQIPAYEYAFGDVNPPVHAWACWRVFKMTGPRGRRDRQFLARAFHKLLLNFTWWVNRKDVAGNNLFAGGFLGLDNIGVFDRSRPLPAGGHLEQADGTAWMAFYCATMLSIALELAREDPSYEDVASKFFEHFVAIVDAMNSLGGSGLWDEGDGFYYDKLHVGDAYLPLRVRSLVGLVPLFAAEVLEESVIASLPGFSKRMRWFLENRPELARYIAYCEPCPEENHRGLRLLAVPSRARLERVLAYVFDEAEFLSPFGIRSLSRHHEQHPYILSLDGSEHRVGYVPGESDSRLFGGNSNWRGPVWLPMNYLLIEALERYHHFYGDELTVELPRGSGRRVDLREAAREIGRRLCALFLPGADGSRPCHGGDRRFAEDPHWRDLVLFHEYFHADTGRGLGASHQTGWTALVARLLERRRG